jgi:hypothetical protein
MKLMDQKEAKISYTQEELYEYLTTSTVISSEAVTDYFAKLKDTLNAAIGLIYTPYNDKAVADILRHKHEVIEKAKMLDYTVTSFNVTSKPINFKGYYTNFVDDLYDNATEINELTKATLAKFKTALSLYINNNFELVDASMLGVNQFKTSDSKREQIESDISKYFSSKNGDTKARFRDIFRSYNDIKPVIEGIIRLDSVIYPDKLKETEKEIESIKGLLDTIVENYINNPSENTKAKQDLMVITNICAKIVEMHYYFYGTCYNFYSVFKNNMVDLLKL